MMKESSRDLSSRTDLKERIILEALEAFRLNGIKAITMDDIANSLKMSKRTLYEVFKDKETLLKEGLIYHQARSKEELKLIVESSDNVLEVILKCYQGSVEAYHKVNKRFFEDIKKYPEAYALLRNSRQEDNQVAIDFLRKGVEQGIFREDINFDIVQALVREQIRLLMNTRICDHYSFLEVYESLMFIYLRGISTQKGAEELEEFIQDYREKKKSPNTN